MNGYVLLFSILTKNLLIFWSILILCCRRRLFIVMYDLMNIGKNRWNSMGCRYVFGRDNKKRLNSGISAAFLETAS